MISSLHLSFTSLLCHCLCPTRFRHQMHLRCIITICVIIHKIIIKYDWGQWKDFCCENKEMNIYIPHVHPQRYEEHIQRFLEVHQNIENRMEYEQLRDYNVKHLWML